MTVCFIGMGANLQRPLEHLRDALRALASLPKTRLISQSSIYRSAPIGPGEQDDYLNAVAKLRTQLQPLPLLDALHAIEADHGRERRLRWGSRSLDLDILLYGEECIDHERLVVPHRELFQRNFALQPLAELVPESWCFPDGSTLEDRLAACPENRLKRSDDRWCAGRDVDEVRTA
ncbi:MAG: 2-amino-4-hydroxy-6-hydroxymethyldihydropteridine diphosphokinase [Congregibacter sp.]